MSYHMSPDWRNRRSQYFNNSSPSMFQNYSISKFSSDVTEDMVKSELHESFLPEDYFDPMSILENPLERSLNNNMTPDIPISNYMYSKTPLEEEMPPLASRLASIGSFFSGVMNVLSAVMPFPRRTKQEKFDVQSGSPPLDFWLPAKTEQPNNKIHSDNKSSKCNDEMSVDCSSAVTECELKLNQVKQLLNAPYVGRKTSPTRRRRPKKEFIDPKSVEESFEDAVSYETVEQLANNTPLEHVSVGNNMNAKSNRFKSPILTMRHKIVIPPAYRKDECKEEPILKKPEKSKEHSLIGYRFYDCDKKHDENKASVPTEDDIEKVILGPEIVISQHVDSEDVKKEILENDKVETVNDIQSDKVSAKDEVLNDKTENYSGDLKTQVIQSCEDKLSKLKALLSERRAKNKTDLPAISETAIEPSIEQKTDEKLTPQSITKPIQIAKVNDKQSSSTTDRRKKCTTKQIQQDVRFGSEIDLNSVENSPQSDQCYFNEIKGRFHTSSTTDSEDSFQIVFAETPQSSPKARTLSDCDSEDSFIIFEDNADSCYTSTDVFGETDSEYDSEDSEHLLCRLNPQYSRTVSDLTQDCLYEGVDDVDSGAVTMSGEFDDEPDNPEKVEGCKGLMLTEAKKLARREQPPKHVHFSEAAPQVRVMRVWAFAARRARAGPWERHALDRERFKRRIADVDMAISWVLKPQHRSRVKFQRFMPWWNKLRRAELAEKKRLAEEKKKIEEEMKRIEEEKATEETSDDNVEVASDLCVGEEEKVEEEKRKEEKATEEDKGELASDVCASESANIVDDVKGDGENSCVRSEPCKETIVV